MLLDQTQSAYVDPMLHDRGSTLALSSLLCLGKHTITGLLSTCSQQFVDWSASYRLFERERVDPARLFATSLRATLDHLDPTMPVVAMIDDTLLPKHGTAVHGAAWRRDPLGPKFQTNLIWAQRFLQCSLALPDTGTLAPGPARGIPVAFRHVPTPRKPRKTADANAWDAYHALARTSRIPQHGVRMIQDLRAAIDQHADHAHRHLIISVDGSYTNHTVFTNLPERTTLIGRVRKDARLCTLPAPGLHRRGRQPAYGNLVFTPDALRQDPTIPWITVHAHAAGKIFAMEVKSIGPVRWRTAGAHHDLRVVIIRPLAYRPHPGSRLRYRYPAYLVCTDPTMPVARILQAYLWRWEIEVNFRDEKSLVGVGQAQVRTPSAAERVPAFQVAAYSLLLAAERLVRSPEARLPRPRWRRDPVPATGRIPTPQLLRMLRAEIWAQALDVQNYSAFMTQHTSAMKPEKLQTTLSNAMCYAS